MATRRVDTLFDSSSEDEDDYAMYGTQTETKSLPVNLLPVLDDKQMYYFDAPIWMNVEPNRTTEMTAELESDVQVIRGSRRDEVHYRSRLISSRWRTGAPRGDSAEPTIESNSNIIRVEKDGEVRLFLQIGDTFHQLVDHNHQQTPHVFLSAGTDWSYVAGKVCKRFKLTTDPNDPLYQRSNEARRAARELKTTTEVTTAVVNHEKIRVAREEAERRERKEAESHVRTLVETAPITEKRQHEAVINRVEADDYEDDMMDDGADLDDFIVGDDKVEEGAERPVEGAAEEDEEEEEDYNPAAVPDEDEPEDEELEHMDDELLEEDPGLKDGKGEADAGTPEPAEAPEPETAPEPESAAEVDAGPEPEEDADMDGDDGAMDDDDDDIM
ncbi:FKBP-type peptidyl-prolyl cis-trans isomerase [Carpediemonas membranifera]|uniref:FKBP-type peptidyl-prolyl cis-trans isomerase n=1 Tax=Carpediemonas membranifera TaxID=201153 RepID=A0A8J6APW6_9EUKA|nr:FKBP-type peptidyl-prolyl cis-trans isomerase [Carpediemonas membranifera]|eukprot:KAG9390133.1 FKBP-type peptidyl-prolyl cis-trans isomerase [Carpediemonas membranifera]